MTVDLARHHRPGRQPTLLFLPGYRSDMTGSKALALDEWAAARGQAMLRFDYRGCGDSPGAFEDLTLDDWLDDVLRMIDSVAGPLVLVGSSMGGWLMLLAALARPDRIAALVGIAAAADFTEWGFDAARRAQLESGDTLREPSHYDDSVMVTTSAFWQSGQRRLLLDKPLPIACPVRLLQGERDAEVPVEIALRLGAALHSDDVHLTLVKDGDHRLSRPQDLQLLLGTVAQLLESLP